MKLKQLLNLKEIRKEFPVLRTKVHEKKLIYLDGGRPRHLQMFEDEMEAQGIYFIIKYTINYSVIFRGSKLSE